MEHLNNNFFIYGTSYSGRNLIASLVIENYDYKRIRLRHTIKSIITEELGISLKELNTLRENNHEIESLMIEVKGRLGEESLMNRLKLIVEKKSMDFELIDYSKNIIISDCQSYNEVIFLLENGWNGIFLTRIPKELRNNIKFLENNMFFNGQMNQIIKDYSPCQIFIIDNNRELSEKIIEPEIDNYIPCFNFPKQSLKTDGSKVDLLIKTTYIFHVLKKIIK
jgi:hypothetical protein